tara:strand:+ start:1549 stop:1857 length:309 start_codon:yes stop_codon:yes gene_type:complete
MGRFNWREDDIWNVSRGLSWGMGSRYTICPPRLNKYSSKLCMTYRRKSNEQWERLPILQDRKKVWDMVADGYVWDRDKEKFVTLDVPYEIADFRGNIKILNI